MPEKPEKIDTIFPDAKKIHRRRRQNRCGQLQLSGLIIKWFTDVKKSGMPGRKLQQARLRLLILTIFLPGTAKELVFKQVMGTTNEIDLVCAAGRQRL